jgi:TPP-dependent pyruvate/acetoin dehydrogenase alpha subunit
MTYTPDLSATPNLSAAKLRDQLELYRRMWVLRLLDMALEESRIDGLCAAPVEAAFGQEAAAVGTAAAVRPGDVVSTTIPHFRHAQQVGLALPLGPAIAEMIGGSLGKFGAGAARRESSSVPAWKGAISSFSGAVDQSTMFALGDAHTQQRAGQGKVALCVIDDRDANSAEFTAAVNTAVSWRLPVVFVVANVRPAAGERGMPVLAVDGNDVEAVRDSVSEAVRRASDGEGPILVRLDTCRRNDASGVDPLVVARQQLIGAGVDVSRLYEVERGARRLVAEAEAIAKEMLRAAEPTSVERPEACSAG